MRDSEYTLTELFDHSTAALNFTEFSPLCWLYRVFWKGKTPSYEQLLNASSLCYPPALPATEQIIGKVSTKLQQLKGKKSLKLFLWRESHKLITVTDPGNIWFLRTWQQHTGFCLEGKSGKKPQILPFLYKMTKTLNFGQTHFTTSHIFLWSFIIHF